MNHDQSESKIDDIISKDKIFSWEVNPFNYINLENSTRNIDSKSDSEPHQ